MHSMFLVSWQFLSRGYGLALIFEAGGEARVLPQAPLGRDERIPDNRLVCVCVCLSFSSEQEGWMHRTVVSTYNSPILLLYY